jgi:hypothetical protein
MKLVRSRAIRRRSQCSKKVGRVYSDTLADLNARADELIKELTTVAICVEWDRLRRRVA